MSFDGLGLSPELLRAVADEGYTEPTPVQAAAIPVILQGRDVLAGAQTGTGKTAAFVLPVIQYLHATRRDGGSLRHPVRVLVVVPTRELAIQVEESVRTYGRHRPIRSATIYGGVGFGPQVTRLRAGPEIVVATPGRLLDHVSQGTIDLSRVEVLILDEADRLLDMGFIRDIRRIIDLLPSARQNLLFSATFSDDVRRLADGLLDDPARIQVTPRNTTAELVDQLVIPVDRERKRDLLRELVALGRVRQALVFTRTKHGANRLAEQLGKDGIRAAAIHGNKSQSQRVKALEDFKAGRVDLLVATDIAARGLDIEQLPHVVNYELPMVPEDYVHRIGRTGRAGIDGQAISLVCIDERPLLQDIQQLLRRSIPTETVPGFEPDRSIRPEPVRLRSTPAERAEAAARRAASRTPDGGGQRGGRAPVAARGQGSTTGRKGGAAPAAGASRDESFVAPGLRGSGAPSSGRGRRGGNGRGQRHRGGAPGTGFGNGGPGQRGAAGIGGGQPSGQGPRAARGRPDGHTQPGRGHQGSHGAPGGRQQHQGGQPGSPRTLPGERIQRLG